MTTVGHGRGGGMSGGFTITNSTISDNRAIQGGSICATGTVQLGDTHPESLSGANIFLLGGTVTSHGYNLSSDNGGGFLNGPGDQINTDPLLGPLQDNGGPTFTHELLPGSPATDAGDPNFRRSHLPGYAAWEIHPVMALRVVQAHARVLAIKFL